MKKVLLFAIASWTIISCERNTKNVVVVYDTINTDTSLIKIDSIAPDKNFSGVLPCKDCDGINSFLTLHPDSNFKYTETKIGADSQDSLIEKSGKFLYNEDDDRYLLSLNFNDGTLKHFEVLGDTALQLLSAEKKALKTDENTVLKKN
ncbi:MAG: copper resistance protein NlpE N-terminal domain-containing protein [Bacteroidota bacterium]|jgi:uncharacterized lipoprotein NlpE involved in copper resistance